MVSSNLKDINQIGNLPLNRDEQKKCLSCHHPATFYISNIFECIQVTFLKAPKLHQTNLDHSDLKDLSFHHSHRVSFQFSPRWKLAEYFNLEKNELVVEPPNLKNISKIGSFHQVGMKITNIWNHHQVNIVKTNGIRFSSWCWLKHPLEKFKKS